MPSTRTARRRGGPLRATVHRVRQAFRYRKGAFSHRASTDCLRRAPKGSRRARAPPSRSPRNPAALLYPLTSCNLPPRRRSKATPSPGGWHPQTTRSLQHGSRGPASVVWFEKIHVGVHGLEEPNCVHPNIGFRVGRNEPARFVPATASNGRRHDEPPSAGGMVRVLDVDDRIQREVRGKYDLAGDALEKALDLISSDIAAKTFAIPETVFDEQASNAFRVIVVVAVGAVSRLQPHDLVDRFEPCHPLRQLGLGYGHVGSPAVRASGYPALATQRFGCWRCQSVASWKAKPARHRSGSFICAATNWKAIGVPASVNPQ